MEGRDFTGHAAFRETLHGPTKLEIDPATADMIEGWVRRFEDAASRMEESARRHDEAAGRMSSAASSMGEAAGTMSMASRR
jgi:hypothetical protein